MKEQAIKYFKAEKYVEAVHDFKKCLNHDNLNIFYNASIWFNLGLSTLYLLNFLGYCKLNEKEEALNAFNKCIELKDDYVKAYFKRGEIRASLNSFDQAISDF